MAGGSGRGLGVPLAERVRGGGPPARPSGSRHCWVSDPTYPDKLPGILLRWENTSAGWRGLVVYALPETDGVVQRWMDAGQLVPI